MFFTESEFVHDSTIIRVTTWFKLITSQSLSTFRLECRKTANSKVEGT
ncbi:hypothetical protein LINPERHAP2_LOCUS8171 [Linum perenne]